MSQLTYVNLSKAEMSTILADYNTKTASVFGFGFFFLMGLFLVFVTLQLKLGIKKALLSSSLVSTFVGMLFWGLNLITYEEALVFGAILLLTMIWAFLTK